MQFLSYEQMSAPPGCKIELKLMLIICRFAENERYSRRKQKMDYYEEYSVNIGFAVVCGLAGL